MSWIDVSSWSRGDVDRTPKSWELRAGRIRIVVTRYHYGEPDRWYLDCQPWFNYWQLSSGGIDAAKKEAVAMVVAELRSILEQVSK